MVVVAMDEKRGRMPLEELLEIRMLGVPIITGEDFYEQIAGRILADRIRPGWLIFSPGFATSRLRNFTKRGMDVGISMLGLILTLPFTLLVALAIKLDRQGPPDLPPGAHRPVRQDLPGLEVPLHGFGCGKAFRPGVGRGG